MLSDDMYRIKLGNNLRELYSERGWTQAILERESGVKQSQISDIENGKRLPTLITIAKLCIALQCSYNDLLPKYPCMKSVDPQIMKLNRIMEKLTTEQKREIKNTAIAAAKYYSL